MADGVGFEPTRRLRACRFSRPVPSTTRPPIHRSQIKAYTPLPISTNREMVTEWSRRYRLTLSVGILFANASQFSRARGAFLLGQHEIGCEHSDAPPISGGWRVVSNARSPRFFSNRSTRKAQHIHGQYRKVTVREIETIAASCFADPKPDPYYWRSRKSTVRCFIQSASNIPSHMIARVFGKWRSEKSVGRVLEIRGSLIRMDCGTARRGSSTSESRHFVRAELHLIGEGKKG